MSKENKTDRLVRTLIDSVTEHTYELKNLANSSSTKELDVERFIQSFLKSCLGFSASAGYFAKPQEIKGKHRPDIILTKNDKPVIVIEIKKLGFDFQKSEFRSGKVQLKEYLNQLDGVRWGILSNGFELVLLDFGDKTKNGVEVLSFDFRDHLENFEINKKLVEELVYDLVDFHETSFASKLWEEMAVEATAFSPDSLARAMLSTECIKLISKTLRGEYSYKADSDILSDRVYDLLTLGLQHSRGDWNELKAAELSKYLKAQKRAARKTRKSRNKDEGTSTEQNLTEESTVEVKIAS